MNKSIDNVTCDTLQTVLLMFGLEVPLDLVDNLIDIVELVEEKGDKVSVQDVEKLKSEWVENGHNFLEYE